MKADLIIYNAGQLVTCASGNQPKRLEKMRELGIIGGGALAISGEKIIGVGSSETILKDFECENTLDAGGAVVCPAFVEPHTHLVYAGDRLDEFELKIKGADYLEILQNGGGILSTVRETRAADLVDLIEQSERRLDKIFKHGVATCEVKTGYGLDTETELKMLEAIIKLQEIHAVDLIPTSLPAHAIPPEYKNRADEFTDLICVEMLPKAAERLNRSSFYAKSEPDEKLDSLPFFADVFCEINAFNLEQSRRVLETAKRYGFKLKAHVDEFTNLGAARMAIELGATSIDHLDVISDEEIKLLAASETIGIVTPTVNFNFGSAHFADARKLIEEGCAIAVSTDYNPGSSPCPSTQTAMAIACRYQKLSPSEAFNAATINAAFAVNLGEEIGSLEVGKQADVLILDVADYRAVAYEFGGNCVKNIIKKGKVYSV